MARVQSVYDKRQSLFLIVKQMLITLCGWSLSLLQIDMGIMVSICLTCQVASSWCGPNVTDKVDAVVVTPLGISDHRFVCCVLHVEQSVSVYNVRSTVF